MRKLLGAFIVLTPLLLVGCATTPTTPTARRSLQADAQTTLEEMKTRDPGLQQLLDQSAGYVVFPEVGKGGVLVGGAYGRGIVYEQGQQVGFADLNQASIGAQLGGQTFSELIVFGDQRALNELKAGQWSIGAGVSAIALRSGAAASTTFGKQGAAVFVVPRGGAMVELSISGQKLNFEPRAT